MHPTTCRAFAATAPPTGRAIAKLDHPENGRERIGNDDGPARYAPGPYRCHGSRYCRIVAAGMCLSGYARASASPLIWRTYTSM